MNTQRTRWTLLTLLLAQSAVGCSPAALRLPPKPIPAQALPHLAVEPGSIPAGHGRVFLDSDDGPTEVVELLQRSRNALKGAASADRETVRPLCTTPCAVDLTLGSHRLVFRREGDPAKVYELESDVVVGETPTAMRVALGETTPGNTEKRQNANALIYSASAAIGGGAGLALAGAVNNESAEHRSTTLPTAGLTAAVAGGFLLVIGLALKHDNRETIRPGNHVQFAMPKPALLPAPAPIVRAPRPAGRERASR